MQNQHEAGISSLTFVLLIVCSSLTGLACVSDHQTSDTKGRITDSASVSPPDPTPQDGDSDERAGSPINTEYTRRTPTLPAVVEREPSRKSAGSRQVLTHEKAPEDVGAVTEVKATETAADVAESDADRSTLQSTEAWTAMDQGNSRRDLQITRSIRRKVSGDKSLSIYARNIVVITKGGIVALKGTVRSDEEKAYAESIARDTEGVADISNHLNVRPR